MWTFPPLSTDFTPQAQAWCRPTCVVVSRIHDHSHIVIMQVYITNISYCWEQNTTREKVNYRTLSWLWHPAFNSDNYDNENEKMFSALVYKQLNTILLPIRLCLDSLETWWHMVQCVRIDWFMWCASWCNWVETPWKRIPIGYLRRIHVVPH